MNTRTAVRIIALAWATLLAGCQSGSTLQHAADPALSIGENDLGGIVRSASGVEAGVWVIAETSELPTRFAKIVVTDDQGRYVLPDLPPATYDV